MTRKPLNVVSVHRNLRAARYQQKHGEGATSDQVQLRYNNEIMQIEYDDFMALTEGLRDSPMGPILGRDKVDF